MTEPPSRLPATLGVLAIIAIVAAVVAIVIVHGGGEPGVAVPTPSTTATSAGPAGDSVVIDNPDARLSYRLPSGWVAEPDSAPEILGVRFTGAAAYGGYDCGGKAYSRAVVFSAAVQSRSDKRLDLRETGHRFAAEIAARFLAAPDTAPTDGEITEYDGHTGLVMTLPVTIPSADPDCEATEGTVTVLAVDLDNATATTKRGIALLVHVQDTAGGPDEPAPPPAADVQAIIDSLAVD
ncbi:hypothetical protein [Actinokineospora sp. UTMC 2448]|uniref:hypothetical protein n=1 Tax=Actinokineospora sp. UTMC 2448 TaxID=2268449 RepID=UPI002164BA65|nr:hypothetical protein [Actinokineospora sp. UTMC 2448]